MDDLSKDDCVSILHDLKIPLNVILGYVSLLRESGLSSQQKRDLEGIEKNSLFLTKMISDLRILVSGEVLEPTFQVFEVTAVMEDLIESFRRSYDLEIQVDFPPELSLRSDPHFLRRILANLLENACRYGQEDKPVKLILHQCDDQWNLEVTNWRGEGKEEKSFGGYNPPEQVDSRDETTPTGLGLMVSKELATAIDGSLEFNGQGKKVKVTLSLPCTQLQ